MTNGNDNLARAADNAAREAYEKSQQLSAEAKEAQRAEQERKQARNEAELDTEPPAQPPVIESEYEETTTPINPVSPPVEALEAEIVPASRLLKDNPNELKRIATQICFSNYAKSKVLPGQKIPADILADAMTIILHGEEVGLSPINSFLNINMIKNRPCITAGGLHKLAAQSPSYYGFSWRFEGEGDDLVCYGIMKRKEKDGSISEGSISFSKRQAIEAGLTTGPKGPQPGWKNYPEDMLLARVKSRLCRNMFPAEIGGLHSQEEMSDVR